MFEQLRGRNLAHIGCTLGALLGLFLGLLAAVVVIQVVISASAVTLATIAFVVVALGLTILGYIFGAVLTRRLWGDRSRANSAPLGE